MLEQILKTLRENKLATGLIFILVFILCFGWQAACYVAFAEVFTFAYAVIVASGNDSGDDFDDWSFA